MHKTKKKTKTATKLPKPIKIKKEKTEEDRTLHPMSHYIDDRLELVKQIFGTLKPKTIVNLAPDFLKKKSMEEIEELCLNELLCISTKRLTSIINATKCPTDTESSSDSDVERHEEHISLEEISSDSEIEGTNAGKKKSTGSNAKLAAKKELKNTNEKTENDGQISVLELLELQARARAIRSQLALEPVTKIEVDSDDQGAGKKEKEGKKDKPEAVPDAKEKESRKEKKRDRNERKRKSSEAEPEINKVRTGSTNATSTAKVNKPSECVMEPTTSSASASKENNKSEEKRASKKIKLKRNYRKSSQEHKENESTIPSKTQSATPSASKDVKRERKSRSPSPDVIPIVAEPETLLISDSSDDETLATKTASKETAVAEKNSAESATVTAIETRKPSETEEGEITENETEKTRAVKPNSEADKIIEEAEATINNPVAATKETEVAGSVDTSADIQLKSVDLQEEGHSSTLPEGNDEESRQSTTTERSRTTSNNLQIEDSNTATNAEDDDDQNDDVISIEGGDLESEMIEHLEEESKSSLTTTLKKDDASPQAQEKDADVISLDSSEDEESRKDNTESWHSRYLKSSKVNKVLLTSRLGKRLRDKIKKSKRTKTDSEHELSKEEASISSNTYTSKHEDGSMEQYKELLEMRQRKN